jgi:ribose/xylose/arabinose/galactoside ABC-type transport system permease subunit
MIIGRSVQNMLARNGTLIGLVLLVIFFYLANRNFVSVANVRNVGEAVSALGVVSIPLALLVICGAVDLSIGSVASLAGIVGALVMLQTGSAVLGILAGLGVGLVAGAINGILVAFFRLNSIVVTLGALSVWGGLALYITNGQTIAGLPASFVDLGYLRVFGIPLEILVLIAAGLYGTIVLGRLPYGRRLYAIGGNRRAAFLMGVPVERVQFWMFLQVGLAAALAGLMLAAKLSAATPITGQGLEINALTVVLLGGVAFTGGMGRISGVVAGLFFVGVLRNGLVVTGTSQFLQQVVLGLTLVAAVAIDDTIRRIAQREWSGGAEEDEEDAAKPAPGASSSQETVRPT